jgi:hypothetical protein
MGVEKDAVVIQLSIGELITVENDGEPWIVLRPAIEALGMDYSTQMAKLRRRSWAVVGQKPTTGVDGKKYRMSCCTVDTFLMLLATINESKVKPELRPALTVFQRETRDAIGAHWTRGTVVQPTLPVDLHTLNTAGAAMADVRRIIATALDEASRVLADASRGIAQRPPEGLPASLPPQARPELPEALTPAQRRMQELSQRWAEEARAEPDLSQSEFIRRYNEALPTGEAELKPPYLSKALARFPAG